jgi:hypothetical protein
MQEMDKIVPLKEIMNDMKIWGAVITYPHIFDMSISTKFVVNFQLYHKSIANLGTD